MVLWKKYDSMGEKIFYYGKNYSTIPKTIEL